MSRVRRTRWLLLWSSTTTLPSHRPWPSLVCTDPVNRLFSPLTLISVDWSCTKTTVFLSACARVSLCMCFCVMRLLAGAHVDLHVSVRWCMQYWILSTCAWTCLCLWGIFVYVLGNCHCPHGTGYTNVLWGAGQRLNVARPPTPSLFPPPNRVPI